MSAVSSSSSSSSSSDTEIDVDVDVETETETVVTTHVQAEKIVLPCSAKLSWFTHSTCAKLRAEACAAAVAEMCLDNVRMAPDADFATCLARLPSSLHAGFSHRLRQVSELLTYFLTQLVARDLVPARVNTLQEFTDYSARFVCPELSRHGVVSLDERTHNLYRRCVLSEDDDDLEMDETYVIVSAFDPRLHVDDADDMLMVFNSTEYAMRHAILNSMIDSVAASVVNIITVAYTAFVFAAVRDVRPALSSFTRASLPVLAGALMPSTQDACVGGAILKLLLSELRTSVNDPPAAGKRLAVRLLLTLHGAALEPVRHPVVLINGLLPGGSTRIKPAATLRLAELFDVRVTDLGNYSHFIVDSPTCIVTLVTRMLSVDYTSSIAKTTLSLEKMQNAREAALYASQTATGLSRVLRAACSKQRGVRLASVVAGVTKPMATTVASEAVTLLCATLSLCPGVLVAVSSYRALITTLPLFDGVLVEHDDGSFEIDLMPALHFIMTDASVKRVTRPVPPRIETVYARPGAINCARPSIERAVIRERFGRYTNQLSSPEMCFEQHVRHGVPPELAAVVMLPTIADVVAVNGIDLCVYAAVFNLTTRVMERIADLKTAFPSPSPSQSQSQSPSPSRPITVPLTRKRAATLSSMGSRKRTAATSVYDDTTDTDVEVSAGKPRAEVAVELTTCVSCYDDECVRCTMLQPVHRCDHCVCKACVVRGVSIAIENAYECIESGGGSGMAITNPLRCFDTSCTDVFDLNSVLPLLSHVHVAMLSSVMVKIDREAISSVPGNVTCRLCECTFLHNGSDVVKTCPVCEYSECTQCNSVSHPGVACIATTLTDSVHIHGDAISASDLVSECSDVVPCPSCKTPYSKTTGCNHMTCTKRISGTLDTCGTHFCYTCGERVEIRPGLLLQHYSGGRCVHDIGGGAAAGAGVLDLRRTEQAIQYARESGTSPITRRSVSAAVAAAALLLLTRS